MVNKVILIGRLAADPELRATANGTHVGKLRLATNTFAGLNEDGTRREHSEFHHLVLFGRQAEAAAEHLCKGQLIFVEGRCQTSSWETPEGQRRQITEVIVDRFERCGPRPAAPSEPGARALEDR